jgi:type VI secretion system protein ImpF
MRDQDQDLNLRASVLDRLVDEDPGVSYEPVQYRLSGTEQIKAAVVRDLENLLNTRRTVDTPGPEFSELNRSVYVYGVGDFTSQNPKSMTVQKQIKSDVEKTIELFEPRLKNVRVQLETGSEGIQSVRFRINALLVMEPETEPVSFDTYFDVNRGEYVISK